MVLMIWSRIPWTIEAIAITVATPITTPRIVSAERRLLARICSKAMSQPSETACSLTRPLGNLRSPMAASATDDGAIDSAFRTPRSALVSLVPQRDHRIELRGAHRRVHAEYGADARAEPEGDGHRPEGHAGGERRHHAHEAGQRHAGREPERAAQQRECHRLGEELPEDVAVPRAERLADPDLPGALVHAHQHDVHDHDPAHDDADGDNGGYAREQEDGVPLHGTVTHFTTVTL